METTEKSDILDGYKLDKDGRLIVDSKKRDTPPHGDHMASGVIGTFIDGEIAIASAFDIGNEKGKPSGCCLPGGQIKRREKDGESELEVETAAAEIGEEIGARRKDNHRPLTPEDIVPVCMISRREHWRADAQRERVYVPEGFDLHQHIFSRFGSDLELHQTTDDDTVSPRWRKLREIIETSIESGALIRIPKEKRTEREQERLRELRGVVRRNRGKELISVEMVGQTFYLKHLIALMYTLQFIGKRFIALREFTPKEVTSRDDLLFFKGIAQEIAKDGRNLDAIFCAAQLNPHKILCQIMGNSQLAEQKLSETVPKELWAAGYYI